jgi:hypothetical protein
MNINVKSKKKVVAKPAQSKKKIILRTCSSIAAAAVISAGTYYLFFKPSLKDAPSVKSDKKQIAGYLASDKFSKLSMDDKKTYVAQLSDGQPWQVMRAPDIPKDEQAKLRENIQPVFQEMQKERLDKFFKMSKEDQQKELEKIAEQMRQRRAAQQAQGGAQGQRPAGGGQPAAGPPPGGGRNSPERQKARYEETSPVTRAQQVEFRKMMMQQMQRPAATPAK